MELKFGTLKPNSAGLTVSGEEVPLACAGNVCQGARSFGTYPTAVALGRAVYPRRWACSLLAHGPYAYASGARTEPRYCKWGTSRVRQNWSKTLGKSRENLIRI